MKLSQVEKPQRRDPYTHIIKGAEPFDFGQGEHGVLFLHGWTSTPRELRFLARKVAEAGFRCRGVLLPGHGTTLRALQGTGWKHYMEASTEAFAELAADCSLVSICGLSMGGLLALHLAARRRVASLVLLAPFLFPSGRTWGLPNKWLVRHAPRFMTTLGKSIEGPILHVPGRSDHIAYHAMPARELMTIIEASRELRRRLGDITVPTLILHSTRDRTSDFAGSLELIRRLGSTDKTLVALEASNHVITLDYDGPRVEAEIVAWLSARR